MAEPQDGPASRPRAWLALSAACWVAVAALAFTAAVGGSGGSEQAADEQAAGDALGQGSVADSGSSTGSADTLALVAGLGVLALLAMWIFHRGWARAALWALGTVTAVITAAGGHWQTLAILPVVAVGALASLAVPSAPRRQQAPG